MCVPLFWHEWRVSQQAGCKSDMYWIWGRWGQGGEGEVGLGHRLLPALSTHLYLMQL